MSLTDKIIEHFAVKYLVKAFTAGQVFLQNKKTYGGAVVGILGTIGMYGNGAITAQQAAGAIWLSAMFVFTKASHGKLAAIMNKIDPTIPNKAGK